MPYLKFWRGSILKAVNWWLFQTVNTLTRIDFCRSKRWMWYNFVHAMINTSTFFHGYLCTIAYDLVPPSNSMPLMLGLIDLQIVPVSNSHSTVICQTVYQHLVRVEPTLEQIQLLFTIWPNYIWKFQLATKRIQSGFRIQYRVPSERDFFCGVAWYIADHSKLLASINDPHSTLTVVRLH
jgi:hypothetical protein